jgi:DNA-binding NtrC family response regulator
MGRKPTLLCVDDDVQCLAVRKMLFEAFGFSVTTTPDPRQGQRLHAAQTFDAVVLDFQMPHINGAELAKMMKVARPEIPVVILSGLTRLPEDVPQYHDRFFCKAESGLKLAQEIQNLITSSGNGSGGAKVPVRKRVIAAAGILFGFATQGISDVRQRLLHGPQMAKKAVATA